MLVDVLSMLEWCQNNQWLLVTAGVIWAVLVIAGLWKMFTKANEAGWKALIPVYNFYILMKICWQPTMFWALIGCNIGVCLFTWLGIYFSFTPWLYVALVLMIIAAVIRAVFYYNLSLAYGHGLGFFFGLYFLEPLFMIIIGFGSSKYAGNRYDLA